MMICAPAGVMYAERELAIPELDFYLINGANFFAGNLASAAFFALLLYYPKQIAPRWAGARSRPVRAGALSVTRSTRCVCGCMTTRSACS